MLDEGGRPTGRSAARSQVRLIEAAARVFHDGGLDAGVATIAATAGLSVATLRRHFPAKDDLVTAVLDAAREQLAAARDHAIATDRGDGGEILTAFVKENARLLAAQRAFTAALVRPDIAADMSDRLSTQAVAIVEPVVDRAHRSGALRREYDADDLLETMRLVALAVTSPRIPADRADRFVDTLLRGLRPAVIASPRRLRLPWAG